MTLASALLAAAALGVYLAILVNVFPHEQDVSAYLAGGKAFLAGRPLYLAFQNHPFPDPLLRPAYIYPPVFALLVAPLALLPAAVGLGIWVVSMQLCLAAAFLLFLFSQRPPTWVALGIVAVTLTFYPLQVDLVQGQVNPAILVLILLGVVEVGRPAGGAGLGLAAALKVSPLLSLAWLIRESRWRSLAMALVGLLLPTLFAAVLRPQDTVTFFGQVLPQLGRGTAYYSNQSLAGLLMRLFTKNPYTHPVLSTGIEPMLWTAAVILLFLYWFWLGQRLNVLARGVFFLCLLPLVSPVTWEHHLVLLLPLLWLTLVRLAERGWPMIDSSAFAFIVVCFSILPRLHPGAAADQLAFLAGQTQDFGIFVAANGLLLCTLTLFFISPWLLRARS